MVDQSIQLEDLQEAEYNLSLVMESIIPSLMADDATQMANISGLQSNFDGLSDYVSTVTSLNVLTAGLLTT